MYRSIPNSIRRSLLSLTCFLFSLSSPAWVSAISVMNANDSGPGSLRQAILDANANPGPDTITFEIPGGGVHTITPSIQITQINDAVTIDGTTQSGYTGTPVIHIDGTTVAALATFGAGLRIAAGPCTIKALCITGFDGHGILVGGPGGNTIEGCHINCDPAGTAEAGATTGFIASSIHVTSPNNVIGGATAAQRNILSGNKSNFFRTGITLTSAAATGNQIIGNYVGTDITGTVAIQNGMGIQIAEGASGNTIGGSTPEQRNLISGNRSNGIRIGGAVAANSNIVKGNYIGLDATGTAAIPNVTGIYISVAQNNVIGGTAPGEGNVISGNSSTNIQLDTAGTVSNRIEGNRIGTNPAGTAALAATTRGVWVGGFGGGAGGASLTMIGGTDPAARNIISGNGAGVKVSSLTTSTTLVLNNYIGTDITGTTAIPNFVNGVEIEQGAQFTQIGLPGAGNLISGNTFEGIQIQLSSGFYPEGTIIQGNLIGVNAAGNDFLPNGGFGIQASGQINALQIGGPGFGEGNVISGNLASGIELDTDGLDPAVSVVGNFIGTDVTHTLALGNSASGILSSDGKGAIIENNYITNNFDGIKIQFSASGNPIRNNAIWDNENNGIEVGAGSLEHRITGNKIFGNLIGIVSSGGDRAVIEGNLVHGNGIGIRVRDVGSDAFIISANSIYENSGLGIEVTDVLPPPPPVIASVSTEPNKTSIEGSLANGVNGANQTYTVEFFYNGECDGSGSGEGKSYLGFVEVLTDGAGAAQFAVELPHGIPEGDTVLTATSRSAEERTSQFSVCAPIARPNAAGPHWRQLD